MGEALRLVAQAASRWRILLQRLQLGGLELIGRIEITAIPAEISSLKKLKELKIRCSLSSLPTELGELPGITKLNLSGNMDLGDAPQDEAFPAELGKMKSLRVHNLSGCALRTVPAFVGELESFEAVYLASRDERIRATLDILLEGCPRLGYVNLCGFRTPESQALIEAFKRKLLARNPGRQSGVLSETERERGFFPFSSFFSFLVCFLFFLRAVCFERVMQGAR